MLNGPHPAHPYVSPGICLRPTWGLPRLT